MKLLKIVLPLFFLGLFIAPTFAYENYNINPFAENNTYGFRFLDQGYNSSVTYVNESYQCFDVSYNGTYIILNNTNCLSFSIDDEYLNIEPLENFAYYHNNTRDDAGDDHFTIDTGKETIIKFKYLITDNSNLKFNSLLLYNMGIGEDSGAEQLNLTENVTHTITAIIEPASYSRELSVTAFFNWGSPADYTSILIDEFSVFTYDTYETRQYWSSNQTTETLRYCGPGGGTYYSGTSLSSFTTYANGTMGYLFCNDTSTGYFATAFKLGNTTIAKRLLDKDIIGGNEGIYEYNNMYFFWGDDNNFDYAFLLTQLELEQAKITVMLVRNDEAFNTTIHYDGTPSPYALLLNNSSGILVDYNQTINSVVDMASYLNDTAVGTQWQWYARTGDSGYYDFFTSSIICDPAVFCDLSTNTQYVRTYECSITNVVSCGAWGCNDDLTGCDYGLVGSYCLNDFTVMAVNATGYENVQEYCVPPDQCYNVSSTAAACLTEEEYGNYNNTQIGFFDNPALKTAFTFGGILGIQDEQTVKDLLSIVVSIIAGVVSAILISRESRQASSHAFQFAAIITLVCLVFFAIGGFLSLGISLIVGALVLVLIFYMVKAGG